MSEFIWISRWEEFQHYRPERDRPPAWIKSYTKQIHDDRYLQLSDRQRALLRDLRDVFAVTFSRLPRDTRVISRHRHRQTFRTDLETLNHAGLIEFISRETLEQRLEKLYSSPRARVEKEKEEEREETLLFPTGSNGATPPAPNFGTAPPPKTCPECEIGGGLHTPDCTRSARNPNGEPVGLTERRALIAQATVPDDDTPF